MQTFFIFIHFFIVFHAHIIILVGTLNAYFKTKEIEMRTTQKELEQMVSESGTVRAVSNGGYGTKKQLATFINGMLAGIEAKN